MDRPVAGLCGRLYRPLWSCAAALDWALGSARGDEALTSPKVLCQSCGLMSREGAQVLLKIGRI